MRKKRVGVREAWFTRARLKWQNAVGVTGGYAWTCPACGYFPGQCELPNALCGNCGETLQTTEEDPEGQRIEVETTQYGYRRVCFKTAWAGDM